MNSHGAEPSPGAASNDSRKRRRNEDASLAGRGGHRGRGRGGRGRGRPHSNGRGGRGNFSDGGRHHQNPAGRSRGRGSGRHHKGRGDGRGGHRMSNDNPHSVHKSNHSLTRPELNSSALGESSSSANVVSEASSLENDSDSIFQDDQKSVAVLPWPNPQSHYIPLEEEERLLPVLIHWGKSERGMMKDQPPFRLQKIQKVLDGDRGTNQKNGKKHNSHRHGGNKQNATYPATQKISLLQSLSLRRHHLKLLNPKFAMSSLRLGKEEDIRDAATLFEDCVDAYLRRHGVQFWSEEDQRKQFDQSMKGVPFHQRKQPPTPDFMMKEGHCVKLSWLTAANGMICDNAKGSPITHPTSIHWIEAKMFYGANTIPSGTPNAVGCILPKVKDYVSLYGTCAIVFMYGCGAQLAAQLLEVGVVALDGRGLDLDRVEKHQKRWCADGWGNILF